MNLCDAVCVVRRGRLVKTLPQGEISQEKIMQHAAGGEDVRAAEPA